MHRIPSKPRQLKWFYVRLTFFVAIQWMVLIVPKQNSCILSMHFPALWESWTRTRTNARISKPQSTTLKDLRGTKFQYLNNRIVNSGLADSNRTSWSQPGKGDWTLVLLVPTTNTFSVGPESRPSLSVPKEIKRSLKIWTGLSSLLGH